MSFFSIDIYSQKNRLKTIIIVVSVMMGVVSMFYTNALIAQLEKREQSQIQLWAKTTEYIIGRNSNEDLNLIFNEVVRMNEINSIPAIVADAKGNPTQTFKYIDLPENATWEQEEPILKAKLAAMKQLHKPIEIDLGDGKYYIYYANSFLLTQLRYFPIIQLFIVALFGIIAYMAFSSTRRAEQNRVWVGLAKETAHQLGTPISSLTAWMEVFKTAPEHYDPSIVVEIEKDIQRLEMITTRFSNIGSAPTLKNEKIGEVVLFIIGYLQKRISTKVHVIVLNQLPTQIEISMNRYLFEWVIENLCKNAVDSMEGIGNLSITIKENHHNQVVIDVKDSGKGIPKANFRKVFQPGFSTKKRGWGLGLTLAKRIIENYHHGKLSVKESEVNKGTTFRIVMPKIDLA